MLVDENRDIFRFTYYKTLTVTTLKEALLFPVVPSDTDVQNLINKLNIITKSNNPALEDLSLLKDKSYKYLEYPVPLLYIGQEVKDLLNLIPVKIEIRTKDDIRHLQTKQSDRVISEELYTAMKDDPLTIVRQLDKSNYVLRDYDKFYRDGVYEEFTVTLGYLVNLDIPNEELLELDVNYDDYLYINVDLPEPLYGTHTFIPRTKVLQGSAYEDKEWCPMGLLEDILNIDINDIKSHIVRKFVYDVKKSVIDMYEDDFDTYGSHKVIIDYINRTWTDDLRYKLEEEFPDIISFNTDGLTKYKRFTLLYRKIEDDTNITIPDDVRYSKDKNYVLKVLCDKINNK